MDAEHSSNYSSLSYASVCNGNIANAYGILQCQPVTDYPPSRSADSDVTFTCGSGSYLYKSRLDSSGREAPDGVSNLPCSTALLHAVMLVAGVAACLPGACAAESQFAVLSSVRWSGLYHNRLPYLRHTSLHSLATTLLLATLLDEFKVYSLYAYSDLLLLCLQNYKFSCQNIGYDCTRDVLYAECGNGEAGADHAYPLSSLADASNCIGSSGNIGNDHGVLVCRK